MTKEQVLEMFRKDPISMVEDKKYTLPNTPARDLENYLDHLVEQIQLSYKEIIIRVLVDGVRPRDAVKEVL